MNEKPSGECEQAGCRSHRGLANGFVCSGCGSADSERDRVHPVKLPLGWNGKIRASKSRAETIRHHQADGDSFP